MLVFDDLESATRVSPCAGVVCYVGFVEVAWDDDVVNVAGVVLVGVVCGVHVLCGGEDGEGVVFAEVAYGGAVVVFFVVVVGAICGGLDWVVWGLHV